MVGTPPPSRDSQRPTKDPFRGPGPVPVRTYGVIIGGALLLIAGLALQVYWFMEGSDVLGAIASVPFLGGCTLVLIGRQERTRAIADE